MPSFNDPPTESPNSFRVVMRKGEMIVRREFQAFGTIAQVVGRLGKFNYRLPQMGDVLPLIAPLDPDEKSGFLDQLDGLGGEDAGLSREWRERLHVGDIQVETNPNERTTHKVVVDYMTSAPADPFAPVVDISVGSETLILKWDWDGNPIAPGFEGGIPVEVPIVNLSYSLPLKKFNEVFDEIAGQVGLTNSKPWVLWDGDEPGDTHQWVFLGADAQKGGERNWKPTFRFIWYPPIFVQSFFVENRKDDEPPVTESILLSERGLYFYWFIERADGSINQNAMTNTNVPGDNMHGLQRTTIRDAFDFNPFFTNEGVDPGAVV